MLTVKTRMTGGRNLQRKLREIKRKAQQPTVVIELGWKAEYPTAHIIPGLAYDHEYGNAKLHLPARPYFRTALSQGIIHQAMDKTIQQLAPGRGMTPEAWQQVAAAARNALRQYFLHQRIGPPLTPGVIERKGHDRPLQGSDEAAMINHLQAWVNGLQVQA